MFHNLMTVFYVVELILSLKMDHKQSCHVLCDLYFSVFFLSKVNKARYCLWKIKVPSSFLLLMLLRTWIRKQI